MASIKDLISSLKKTKDKAISDNEGWFREGKFTPKQQLQQMGQNLQGWGDLAKQGIKNQVDIQKSDFNEFLWNPLKENPVLAPSLQRFENAVPALKKQLNPFAPKNNLAQNWEDSKKIASAGLSAYGLIKAPVSAVLGGAAINPLIKIGTNAYENKKGQKANLSGQSRADLPIWAQQKYHEKKPITEGVGDAILEGAGAGLANAGTNKLTNALVQNFAQSVPLLNKITEESISKGAPVVGDTLKEGTKKFINTAGKRFFKAAVIETAVESPIWATLNRSEQETFLEALEREAKENLAMNIGMAGVQSVSDAKFLLPIVNKSVNDSYTKLFRNPDGSVKTRSASTTLFTPVREKYKNTVNIQDKNDLEYLRKILSEDQINDIKSGKMVNWRGTPYEDVAKVNLISETPKTIEQQLKGKIKEVKLKSDTFYHGTSAENAKGIREFGFKKGSELPEETFRGGGYGQLQNSISFTETPKVASIFSRLTKNGEIVESKLKPNSKVVSIDGVQDAMDVEDYLDYLKKQKVDAVYIGGGEKELLVINPKSISPVSQPSIKVSESPKVKIINPPPTQPLDTGVKQPTIKITKAGENMPQAVIKIRPEQSGLDSSPFGGLRNQQPGLSQTPQRLYTDKGQFEQPSNDIIAQAKKQIGKASETPNKSIKQTADDIYTQWIDRYNPITKATDTAKKQLKSQGAELRPEFDPTYAVRRLTGAGGIADARFKTELEPVIKEMDNLGIAKDDIDVYLANRRIKGFGDIGRDVYGADSVRSAKVVSALENKYGDSIKQIAEKLYKYQDDGFDEMIRAGFISPETAKVIKSQNPDYAPLQRVMDEVDNYLGLPTRKTMQGSQPIVKLKGSTRQIDSPLENIIGNTFKQRAAIEKNNVASQIAGLQNVAELGFKKIAKSGNDTITVWKNGQKEYWQVGEEIADVAKGLNEENMNTLLKIFTAPASLLRQGATGRNPEFMVPNVIRDQLDAGITSRYGYIPFVDYLSGLKSMLKNDEIYQKWASSGAKIDLGELSGRKGISQYFDEKTAKKGLFSWLGSAMDTMGKYSEEPTRIGLFKKAYQKTGNELLAMMESRDATVDFARMGSKMKVANSIIPFLNVGIQGFDKLIRSVKNNPGKVLLNASIYGALPAITTTLYNLIYHGEEYNEIPSYERDGNFVLIKGRNEEGTVDYVTIPKGNVIPVIANPIQSLLEYMAGNSQQSFGQFATQFFSSTLPVVGEGQSLKEVAVKTVGSNMPQLIKPITENLVNKSFYKYDTKKEETKEIVPYYLKNKEPYQQSYKFTPSMYKSIGAVLNVSPLQVQNLMEGYLAGYAKIPAQMIEIAKSISRGDEVNPNQKTLLRRFLKQTYPSSSTSKKTEEKTTPFMERVTGKAKAAESNEMELPSSINELSVLYKDASSTIKTYGDKKTKITYGLTKGELSDLQDEVDSAIKLKKQIEKEHPEAVFQIGIETYKSGGGMDVYERAKWVKQQLEGKEGKERQDLITLLTNSKVITSSVAKELGELGVKGVSGSGTKIKVGTTPKFKSPTIKISSSIPKVSVHSPSIKISMPKTSQSKVKLPTFKKANLANKTVKVKQFRQPVVKIKNG